MLTRSFVRAVAAVASIVVLAACGSAAPSSAGGAAVDRDVTLRVALYYKPSSLDPHRATSTVAGHVYLARRYDRLTHLGPDLTLEPMLAERWEFAPDVRSVTFALRRDARFWDGTPVVAAAVKGSLDRALTLPGSTAAGPLSMIAGVEAVDPGTLRITTNDLLRTCPTCSPGWRGGDQPGGTGQPHPRPRARGVRAVRLTALAAGERVEVERVDGYWDSGAQQARRIVVAGIPNDNTRLSALRGGEQDLVQTTPGQFAQSSALCARYATHAYRRPRRTPCTSTRRHRISTARRSARRSTGPSTARRSRTRCSTASAPRRASRSAPPPSGLTLYTQMATALLDQLRTVGVEAVLDQQEAAQMFASCAAGSYDGLVNNLAMKATAGMTLDASYLSKARFPGDPPASFVDAVRRTADPALDDQARAAAARAASGVATDEAMSVFVCSAWALWTSTTAVVGADRMGLSYLSNFGDLRGVGVTGKGR